MISGPVIHGDGLGKELGYPTANLNVPESAIKFSSGVYAAEAILCGTTYKSALVLNKKPWKVEVYFIDYTGTDFYGENIMISPVQKVSELERYDSLAELKEKIAADVKLVNEFFSERVRRQN